VLKLEEEEKERMSKPVTFLHYTEASRGGNIVYHLLHKINNFAFFFYNSFIIKNIKSVFYYTESFFRIIIIMFYF
jgi:hypothetical protein